MEPTKAVYRDPACHMWCGACAVSEREYLETGKAQNLDVGRPIPAARPLSEFCVERVGNEFVLFDAEHNRYHTVNGMAYEVWRLCDGSRSTEQITVELTSVREGVVIDAVSAAIAQLGESGLLEASEAGFESTLHRRKMMKLVAAGSIGAVGIPVVASITRLGPEASASCGVVCTAPQVCCGSVCGLGSLAPCTSTSECCSGLTCKVVAVGGGLSYRCA